MPKTLVAVDDSVTMRKVLEITFAGDEFRVVTADNSQDTLTLLRDEPVAVVIDTALDGEDGYAVAKEVRARAPNVAIVLLTSRFNPYDTARGRDAGADDYADKPFDTQVLIDKTKKAIVARETATAGASATRSPAMPASPLTAQQIPAQMRVGVASRFSPAVVARPAHPTQRTHTLSFDSGPHAPPGASPTVTGPAVDGSRVEASVGVSPPPSPAAAIAPMSPPAARASSTVVAQASGVQPRPADKSAPAAIDGGMLAELGLTAAQTQAVLALSREVVEKAVWEIVPQLAETMIREEIARLTKEE